MQDNHDISINTDDITSDLLLRVNGLSINDRIINAADPSMRKQVINMINTGQSANFLLSIISDVDSLKEFMKRPNWRDAMDFLAQMDENDTMDRMETMVKFRNLSNDFVRKNNSFSRALNEFIHDELFKLVEENDSTVNE